MSLLETKIAVHLTPGARQDAILGWREDVLWAQVTAPPVEGRANAALLRLLAQALEMAPGRLRLAAGHRSREKLVAAEGMTGEEIRAKLGA